MSFLIDPPWLYATGRAYGRLMPDERTPVARGVVHTATAGAFLATSISLYLDRPWTRPIWKACRAQQRARLDAQLRRIPLRSRPRRATDARGIALLFVTYPFWLLLGDGGGAARGRPIVGEAPSCGVAGQLREGDEAVQQEAYSGPLRPEALQRDVPVLALAGRVRAWSPACAVP